MQVFFVWHECPLSMDDVGSRRAAPKRVFWVTATETEVREYLRKFLSPEQWEEFERRVALGPDQDDERVRGQFPFMIADDLSRMTLFIRIYPISDMWNGSSPWKRFDATVDQPHKLASLDTSGSLRGYGDRDWAEGYAGFLLTGVRG